MFWNRLINLSTEKQCKTYFYSLLDRIGLFVSLLDYCSHNQWHFPGSRSVVFLVCMKQNKETKPTRESIRHHHHLNRSAECYLIRKILVILKLQLYSFATANNETFYCDFHTVVLFILLLILVWNIWWTSRNWINWILAISPHILRLSLAYLTLCADILTPLKIFLEKLKSFNG